MVVAAANPVVSFVGTSSGNQFPYPFPVFQASDLVVNVVSPAGTGFGLVLGTDYAVSNINPSGTPVTTTAVVVLTNAGQQWLTAGNLITGWTLTINRVMALAQSTSIRNGGDFLRGTLENALDSIVMMIQQLQQLVSPPPAQTTTVRKYQQGLIGTVDGVNKVFTVPDSSFIAGSEEIFLGGIALKGTTDYTITGVNQITYTTAPQTNQTPHWANYNR